MGSRVAKLMMDQLSSTGHDAKLFDPQELDLPLLKKASFFYREGEEKPQVLINMEKDLREADGFVFVSGEYNHTIPPALSNMIDHFGASVYSYKPSAICCYSPGIFGGMRAAMHLRCMLSEIGCLSVSNIFGIPRAHEAIAADGSPIDKHMESGATKLIAQLDWYAHALRNHRETAGIPK